MDDARAGRLLRSLRRRAHLTQRALGALVGLSQQQISQLELGRFDVVQTRTVRAAFRGVGASADWEIRWRGGAIDRLLDERHAALAGAVTRLLRRGGWQVIPEFTYSEYGERGSDRPRRLARREPHAADHRDQDRADLDRAHVPQARREGAPRSEGRS